MNYKIVEGDCRYMWEVPNESVDLIFTSPPYFSVKKYENNENNIGNINMYEDYLKEMDKVFTECIRVLRDGCYFVVNISCVRTDDSLYPIPFDYQKMLSSKIEFKECVIWEKTVNTTDRRFGVTLQNPNPRYYYPNNIYEFTLIFRKGKFNATSRLVDYRDDKINVRWLLENKFNNDVWRITPESHLSDVHEAPFPKVYAELVINLFSFRGETVLDPFLGSGTTMVMSRHLRRNCIGYEINSEYVKLIKERVGFNQTSLSSDKFIHVKSMGNTKDIVTITKCSCGEDAVLTVTNSRLNLDCDKCGKHLGSVKDIWEEYK